MNIQKIADNLRNTITHKEQMLAEQRSGLALSYLGPILPAGAEMACIATIQLLEINIDELNCILADLEKCKE